MKILKNTDEKKAIEFITLAIEVAKKATCLRSKCGCVIIKDNKVIGTGFNSPPGELDSQRRCNCNKKQLNEKVTDKTCCVHAEQRAIMNALEKNAEKIKGSTLYFIRLDENDVMLKAGNPYCTHCSKLALDSGIKEFVLWHDEGIAVYNTEEYNVLSYQYIE